MDQVLQRIIRSHSGKGDGYASEDVKHLRSAKRSKLDPLVSSNRR